nr:site-specific integrase [Streptomyces buecherae]
MANIQKRPNGKWRARYCDLNGKEHARQVERKLDAQCWLGEDTASMVTGQYVDPRVGRVTFEKYPEKRESSFIASEAGERISDNALRLHLLPAPGARSIATIRRNDVQVLFKHLYDQLGPGSAQNVYDVLVRVMTAAVDDKVIASSLCRRITLPAMLDAEVTPSTVEQVEAMARVMSSYIRAAVVTLAGSGLRIGELLGLKVSDVDFKTGTIHVDRRRLQSGRHRRAPRASCCMPIQGVAVHDGGGGAAQLSPLED